MTRTTIRVLMTADTVGGVWTYAYDLIGALAPYGVEVILATNTAPAVAWPDDCNRQDRQDRQELPCPLA